MSDQSSQSDAKQREERFFDLVSRHLGSELGEAEAAELSEILRDNAPFQRQFVMLTMQARLLATRIGPELLAEQDKPSFDLGQLRALMPSEADATTVVDASELMKRRELERKSKERAHLESFNRLGGVTQPVDSGSHTRHYVIPRPLFYGSIAAVIAIAVAIIWPMFQHETQSMDDQPVDGSQPRVVAKLTGELDAQWEEASGSAATRLKVGDGLAVGQILQLMSGSAEITTNYGAQVILESPCSIEFIDNDNGFRLHRGKVVGLIETDKARGFIIRTNHVDVTDFGTKFGVDASNQSVTKVRVFEGDVEVARSSRQDPTKIVRKRLFRGQAVRATAGSDDIEDIDAKTTQFLTAEPRIIHLENTGIKLYEGDKDKRWEVVAIDGRRLDTPLTPVVFWESGLGNAYPNDHTTSQWIGFKHPVEVADQTTYTFRTTIKLPKDFDPSVDRIDLKFMADNQLKVIRVNGQSIDMPPHELQDFSEMAAMTIDRHLIADENIIELDIVNHRIVDNPGPVGLRMEWQIVASRRWPTWAE